MSGDKNDACYWEYNCEECALDCSDQCDFFTPITYDYNEEDVDQIRSDFRDEWWDYLYKFYNER